MDQKLSLAPKRWIRDAGTPTRSRQIASASSSAGALSSPAKTVIHSFSGNVQESQQALQLGFYLGVTGPVTYKNADVMRKVVKAAPLNRLLIETDGPFLSPQAKRGKRNEPAHVCYIVDKISEVVDLPVDRVAEQTTANAAALFLWE